MTREIILEVAVGRSDRRLYFPDQSFHLIFECESQFSMREIQIVAQMYNDRGNDIE